MTVRDLPPPLERDVQESIVAQLQALGYRVLVTTVHVKLPAGQHHTGQTPGIPDLYVTRRGWGNRWVAIEVKRPRLGKPSPAQQALIDAGHVAVATCLEEALEILREKATSGPDGR